MNKNPDSRCMLLLAILLATPISGESHSESWGYSMEKYNNEPAKVNGYHREESQGYHGCIFSPTLCNDQEYCFDDQLFGRCTFLSEDPSQIETYQLENEDRELIIDELQILEESGFGWNNQFTQCILNTLAFTIKSGSPFDKRECEVFLENMLVDEFPELNEQPGPEYDYMEPADVIANTASPVDDDEEEEEVIPMDFYSPESLIQESIVPKKLQFEDLAVPPSHDISEEETEEEEDPPKLKFSDFANTIFRLRKSDDGHIVIYPNEQGWEPNEPVEQDATPAEVITSNVRKNKRSQNIPPENADTFPSFNYIPDENINIQFPSVEGNDFLNDVNSDESEPYVVYEEPEMEDSPGYDMPLQSIPVQSPRNIGEIPTLTFGGLGSNLFDRKERLDVKKPGPFYRNSGNNFFLDKLINSDYEDHPKQQKSKGDIKNKNKTETATTDANDIGQVEYEMPLLAPVKDKRYIILTDEIPEFSPSEDHEKTNTVHIKLGKRLDTMAQAEEMIKELADIFDISPQALSDHLIEENHVQFRVDPNPQNLGAKDIAERIDSDHLIKKRIDDQFGVNIDRARAGKTDDHFAVLFPDGPGVNMLVLAVVTASAIAALSVMLVMYILITKSRNASLKMKKQHAPDNERGKAQEEYQQLCRDWSRSSKKSEHSTNSPNGRTNKTNGTTETRSSSTSSWSDDPNTTNMDISTGHMVLAYMEDHLKNKQRLEQEWVALCSYETDPSSTNVAFKAENKKKNRYPDKLPYDHNRVILNAMSSATNSDYINASTVTDSDPRNPSYIVTQGPLSNTVADFWQMIWEQGCVVMVMLTKLNENGQQLCHRYWPEEGSEQYHIFEVHLVSEHVWCDDYLVRSVYLKNTRTGETRTVTQFHFLSWPPSGVPAITKSLLEFRRKVNKSYRGRSCPIAVHCSDGVGRAGTYILIDMVLNRMAKGCKEIDIAATLEHIRDQRGGMVQSRQQFEFCLMAVAEEVHAILKALPQ